ncbi:DUF4381 domain-containing protein [Sulfurivirga sp.]|uniref:DUF4381 domain-containing protein n=1 Tax=Sulfurivirga sp. TaxID=2614236 RepID=UPI0025E7620A|nr:DUF4381 domain-containing protein [Sulfurivirga sp.]
MNGPPLDKMADIILPPPVGWWPLAEVWWFIIVGTLGFITWAVWMVWRNWALDRYRREAISRLDEIERQWRAGELDNPIEATNLLMKRVAVTAYTPEQRGTLHGAEWAAFLRRSAVRVQAPADLERLIELAYHPDVSRETEAVTHFLAFAREWIRRHHQ